MESHLSTQLPRNFHATSTHMYYLLFSFIRDFILSRDVVNFLTDCTVITVLQVLSD